MKYLAFLVLTVAVLGGGAFYYGGQIVEAFAKRLQPQEEISVPTLTLQKSAFRMVVPAKGELRGFQTVPVVAPRVRRRSVTIGWLMEEGSLVNQGDVVVQFDESEAQLALEASDAEFSSYRYRIEQTEEDARGEMEVLALDREAADVELDYATQQIRKDEEIFPLWEIQESLMSAALAEFKQKTVTTKGELRTDVTGADLKILDIDKREAEAEMEEAQDALKNLTVVAPVSGVLIYKRWGINTLEVGSTVYAGQPLMEVASMNQFRALVQVLEKDISGVEPGKPVRILLEAFPELEFEGKVDKVARIAKQLNREDPRKYFECDVLLEVPMDMMSRMKPGMAAVSEIEIKQEEGFILPKSAVIKKDSAFVVFLREGEEYREVSVEIVASDHGFYEVNGVEEGAEVCLRHPYEDRQLVLPDFSAPRAPTRMQRYVIYW